jgi:alkylation response protein AidB-like acyl-CoA dehydrogenase
LDFDLNKEQQMIRKEVRKFAENEISPIALELDEKEEFSAELTKRMGEIGFFGMFVSEEYEGQDMDYLSYIIIYRGPHGRTCSIPGQA